MGELVKCETLKIYATTKNSYQARHIRPPSRILETLAGHGHVPPPGQTCPAPLPYLGSRDLTLTCPAPSPDMSNLSALSRVNQAYPAPRPSSRGILLDISGSQPGHIQPNPIPQ
jgi:hypothetical protein